MKDTIVIDLDGTLSDCNYRRHLVTGKHRDYAAFHAQLESDPVNEWCARLMGCMHISGYMITIVSARPKSCEKKTLAWLEKNKIKFDSLNLLRVDGSDTPDQEIKVNWARNYGVENILFWVDDRAKVVKPIRDLGVTVLHCAEGAY